MIVALLQICAGFYAADFVSGFFHWIEDTYLDYAATCPPVISEEDYQNLSARLYAFKIHGQQ